MPKPKSGAWALSLLSAAILAAGMSVPKPSAAQSPAPSAARIDGPLSSAIDQFLRQQGTFSIDLGNLLVCAAPATQSRFSTLSSSQMFDRNFHRAIFESVYRHKYLLLKDAGYIEITDGPAISEPQTVRERRRVPAPAKRIACSRSKHIVVRPTEKGRASDPQSQPDQLQKYLTLPAGRVTLSRLARDEIVQLRRRYRVVEFEVAADWEPLYLRMVDALGHRRPTSKQKAILIFVSPPGTSEITLVAGDMADMDKPYSEIGDVRRFLERRELRPNIRH